MTGSVLVASCRKTAVRYQALKVLLHFKMSATSVIESRQYAFLRKLKMECFIDVSIKIFGLYCTVEN